MRRATVTALTSKCSFLFVWYFQFLFPQLCFCVCVWGCALVSGFHISTTPKPRCQRCADLLHSKTFFFVSNSPYLDVSESSTPTPAYVSSLVALSPTLEHHFHVPPLQLMTIAHELCKKKNDHDGFGLKWPEGVKRNDKLTKMEWSRRSGRRDCLWKPWKCISEVINSVASPVIKVRRHRWWKCS